MTRKVLALAFDSPSLEVIHDGIAEGWMPTFADLVRRGQFVRLDDLQDVLTTPSWPTLIAGTEVDEHQLVADTQIDSAAYRVVPAGASDALVPPFWMEASAAGLRTTIASVYGAPFVEGLLGTQVIGWGTHCPFTTKLDAPRSEPRELLGQLTALVGPRAIGYGHDIPRTQPQFRSFVADMLESVEQQITALKHLSTTTAWDLFLGAFSESHDVGHFVWHHADPAHPDHDPDADPALRDALRNVYAAIDRGLADVIATVPPDTTVFVYSPYGMGPGEHYAEIVEEVLERVGLLARSSQADAAPVDLRTRVLRGGRRVVQRVVPAGLRPFLGKLVPRDRWLGEIALSHLDWARTRAYVLPGDGSAYIRINLAGREPAGTVQPGAEYDELCATVIERLHTLVDADDGTPVVARAERTDRLLGVEPGSISGPLPDICVGWVPRYRSRAVRLGDAPLPLPVPREDPRSALHRAPGFILGVGPGIAPSGTTELQGGCARIVDVAPTILSALGIAPSEVLRGSALRDLVG